MLIKWPRWVGGCLLAIVLLALAQPAFAHAVLVRSTPEANASLTTAPTTVEIFFSETLEASFSTILVYDSAGNLVTSGDARLDPADATHLIVPLQSLPDGVYTVSWRVLSAVDGHITSGAFPFAVGNADAAALAAAQQASRQIKLPISEVLAKWWAYVALAALLGGAFFVLVVWQPAQAAVPEITPPAWMHLAFIALGLALLGNALNWFTQAGQAAGVELVPPWDVAASRVLFVTRYGVLWLARFALIVILIGLVIQARTQPRWWWAVAGVTLLALLTISLGSHAAAEPQPLWPVLGDWVHLIAASVWIGGLVFFGLSLWHIRATPPVARTRLTALLVPRFSALALLSVGILSLTGFYMSVLRIGAWDNLFNTFYGRVLLIKLLIALPMVGFGAVNLLWVTPNLKRGAQQPTGSPDLITRFRGIVTSEVTLGVLLLLSVGLLTALPPAQLTATTPELRANATAEDLTLDLVITPGRVGINTFSLQLTANGQPVTSTKYVALRFTPTNTQLAQSEVQMLQQGNGLYTANGAYLSLPDTWQVQAVVRRPDKFDAFANYNFAISATGATATYPWHFFTGGFAIAAALAGGWAVWLLLPQRRVSLGLSLASVLGLLVVGAWVVYRDPYPDPNNLVNPIPPNADSVAQGQALYTTYCVPCHGVYGKGDGPVGLTLSPRPADLSVHGVPGVHTDGRLYDWITNGFAANPIMPKFRESLTDDQRWHLVNFLRELPKLSQPTTSSVTPTP